MDAAPHWDDLDYAQISRALLDADKVVILTHVYPDGDAIGSTLAMRDVLEGLGKDVCVVHSQGRPVSFGWLERGEWLEDLPTDLGERVALVLDTAAPTRVAAVGFEGAKQVLVVDHHQSNPGFGDHNCVQPYHAAVGEMLPDLINRLGGHLTPTVAASLYTAVYTDTGRLRYGNVTDYTRRLTAALGRIMGDGGEAVRKAIEDWPPSWVRYAQKGLERARQDGDAVVSQLSLADLRQAGVPDTEYKDAATIAIDFLQDRKARFYVQVYDRPDGTRSVSLRCPDESCSAAEIAQRLGGGGHVAAAGLTTELEPEAVIGQVLSEYRALIALESPEPSPSL